jgi:hypothetical protein
MEGKEISETPRTLTKRSTAIGVEYGSRYTVKKELFIIVKLRHTATLRKMISSEVSAMYFEPFG